VNPTKPLPSQEELLEFFVYEPDTGLLTWRISVNARAQAGYRAGTKRKQHIRWRGKFYRICRVIYKLVHNEEPPEVDHIDGDRNNMRIDNLRAATRSQNGMNKGAQINNKLGVKGVHVNEDGSYTAQIRVPRPEGGKGKMTYLGRHKTVEEAAAVYAEASRKYHGEFGRTK
jgi:hypothetical protein